jgi:hypothetical protein
MLRGQRLVYGCPSVLSLCWEDPIKLGYLKQKPNLFCRLTPSVVQVGCLIVDAQIIWWGREGCSHPLRRTSVKVIASRSVIIAKVKSSVSVKLLSVSKVLLIESLDYNLLSVSQLCEVGYNCLFTDKGVTVFRRSDDSFAFKGVLRGKLYLVDFIPEEVELDRCLITKTNMGWLWHRRLAHVGMRNLHKL